MTAVLVQTSPADPRPAHGGRPARIAVLRWAWRLYRRQWRQQLLIVSLLTVSVAATTFGLGVVVNVPQSVQAQFGTANTSITFTRPTDRTMTDMVARARLLFGTVEAIAHRHIAVPGSVEPIDVRAQDPHGPFSTGMLRLRSGRLPRSASEVAVTRGIADLFGLHVGDRWTSGTAALTVVGIVENPLNLQDDFALVAADALATPDSLQLLVHTSSQTLTTFHPGGDAEIARTDQDAATQRRIESISVLLIATIGMLFVGLLSVAGFTVLVQRRQRALGMLAAIGATDRHVKLAMIANGFIVGSVGALLGVAAGLTGWMAFAPTFEHIAEHRIDRFDLPWWSIAGAVVLAIVTAIVASWWPARAASHASIVSALSGRPAPLRPAHRFAAAGLVASGVGYGLLALAHQRNPLMIIAGVVLTSLGMLLLAPIALRALATLAPHTPIAIRLALRDLARYQARSGAAVAAVSLAIGIAATITLAAAMNAATHATQFGNLPTNALIVRTQPDVGPMTELTADQVTTLRALGQTIAAAVGAGAPVELDVADSPTPITDGALVGGGSGSSSSPRHEVAMLGKVKHLAHGTQVDSPLQPYVATPELLRALGVSPSAIEAGADLITSRTDLGGMELLTGRRETARPVIQHVAALPEYTSEPSTLITMAAVSRLGLTAAPSAWLIAAPHALTRSQINDAIHRAAAAGVVVESRKDPVRPMRQLRDWSTASGIVTALAVLAMTVGLMRTDAANDVRTLTATGASAAVRRMLTAATAAALGLLGGVIGTATAYLALLAWNVKHPGVLSHVPVLNLAAILLGLPLAGSVGGLLMTGREPAAIARRPLD